MHSVAVMTNQRAIKLPPSPGAHMERPVVVRRRQQRGFTLLEVMVALTIAAFVLGGLFTLAAGSKQLAVRTQNSLHDTVATRAALNFHLLDNQYRGLENVLAGSRFRASGEGLLTEPPRRTMPLSDLLEQYQITDSVSGEVYSGVRWVHTELPQ